MKKSVPSGVDFIVVAVYTLVVVTVGMVNSTALRLEEQLSGARKEIQNLNNRIAEMTVDLSLLLPPCYAAEEFIITAYEPSERSCGKWAETGLTKTGTRPAEFRTAAVDPELIPLGSLIFVSGVGWFVAEDTGRLIKGKRIDLFFNDIKTAVLFGRKKAVVYYPDSRCFRKEVFRHVYSEKFASG